MTTPLFDKAQQTVLLQLAQDSVTYGVSHGKALTPINSTFDVQLQEHGAAFVTLEKHGDLRGCIGSVEAYRPLVEDIAANAWAAAFQDPRFNPVISTDIPHLSFEISVLTKPQAMQFTSEENLKQQLSPGVDGLLIEEGYKRSLFLPAVWEKLPDIESFLSHLKQKAGLSSNYWSNSIQVKRFYSFEFSDDD